MLWPVNVNLLLLLLLKSYTKYTNIYAANCLLQLFSCYYVQAAVTGKGNGKRWFNRRTSMFIVQAPKEITYVKLSKVIKSLE